MMGISRRSNQEKSIKAFEGPLWDANTLLARNAGNIMYGGDTSSPANYNRSLNIGPQSSPMGRTAVPRQRSPGITTGPMPRRTESEGNIVQGRDWNQQDNQSIIRDLIGNRPLNVETLRSIEPQLAQSGMKLRWNARGTGADIILPNGTEIDFIGGMEGPEGQRTFQWDATGETVGGGGLGSGEIVGDGRGGQGVAGPGAGGVAQMSIDNYLDLMNRYGEFAKTGGYDSQTLDAIRSRALSPSRAVYSDVNRSIDRSRSLQGDYSPNYAAVKAKTAREQSMALSDATTNVEGGIGQMVQRGRLAGLGGMSSLYGTTPGLANMFGNQAMQGQALQNQAGFGLIDARQRAEGLPGAASAIGNVIGSVGGMIFPWSEKIRSDRNIKKNIKPIKRGILFKLKKLPISTWSYKDDPDGTIHIGPMAQDFYELFGGDDDKTIHPVDVAGVTLGAIKELAENAST